MRIRDPVIPFLWSWSSATVRPRMRIRDPLIPFLWSWSSATVRRGTTKAGMLTLISPASSIGLPFQVEGINGNAMPAHAPTGIKGHKTERLGLGHVDHLPDINTHRAVNDLQFVNQCDVD